MAMVDKIAVIGAGLVGRGWAIVCARANRRVALYDSNPEALPLAMQDDGIEGVSRRRISS